ncbi:hypothetical protein BBP40_000329 [Aspergillus hancockii]|nr:hypothetical protein BBP40_000329 [Aspergillus hancockii]
MHVDRMSTLDMCRIINSEDHNVAESVKPWIPQIAAAVDAPTSGGRVIYTGACTSGRIGILDASEIPSTLAVPRSQFMGMIAGGDATIRRAQEGAEDSVSSTEADLAALELNPELDSVIGIAASGRTPYALGCMVFPSARVVSPWALLAPLPLR